MHWQSPVRSPSSPSSLSTRTLSIDSGTTHDDQPVGPKGKSPRLQPDELISVPDGLLTSFQLPQHFGRKIDAALTVGKPITKYATLWSERGNMSPHHCRTAYTNYLWILGKEIGKKYPCLGEKDPRDYLKAVGVKVTDKGKPFKNWVTPGKKYVFDLNSRQICTAVVFFIPIKWLQFPVRCMYCIQFHLHSSIMLSS